MLYDIKTKVPKPKWYQANRNLSNFFLRLAKKCYKENPEVYAFTVKQMIDYSMYGTSITRIDPKAFHDNEVAKEIKNG